MDIRRTVGANLRRFRLAAGYSQEELADKIGVQQGYLSQLEAGKRNPTILTIWHASRALGIEPQALFGASKPRKKPKARRKSVG